MQKGLVALLRQIETADDETIDLAKELNKLGEQDDVVALQVNELAEKLRDALVSGKARRIQGTISEIRSSTKAILLNKKDIEEFNETKTATKWPENIPTSKYLLAFQEMSGKSFEQMICTERQPVEFINESKVISRSPNALFQFISRQILNEVNLTKGKQICIHIRDGKSINEARKIIAKEYEITQVSKEYILAFERGAKKKLEDIHHKDTDEVKFTTTIELQRTPYALFVSIAKAVLDHGSAFKGKQICIYIRDGKSIAEARQLVEKEQAAHEVNKSYILAFQKGTNKHLEEIDITDNKLVTFRIGPVKIQRTPSALFQTLSRNILGKKSLTKGKQLCIYIRDGKTQEEAKMLVEKQEEIKDISRAYLLAFQKGAGIQLEEMRCKEFNHVTFNLDKQTINRSPNSIFTYLSIKILDVKEAAKGQKLAICIRDGKTNEQAKKSIQEIENYNTINKEYLCAFEKGAKKKIKDMGYADSTPINFTVNNIKFNRSPQALFAFVSNKILGEHNVTKGKKICRYICEGKTIDEAIKMLDEAKEANELSQSYLQLFVKESKKSFEDISPYDKNPITFKIENIEIQRSPNALFQYVQRVFLSNKLTLEYAKLFCTYILNGKTIEESKKIINLGNEGIEDFEFEEFSKLNLQEIISFCHSQEGGDVKLKIYLMFGRGLNESQANKIVTTAFKAFYGTGMHRKEDEYLTWPVDMPQPKLSVTIPLQTEETTITLTGVAPESECVFISGALNCRKRVEPDGSFSIPIPLAIGEANEIRIMSIDRSGQRRSMQKTYVITQEGEVDDTEELIRLLGELGTQLTKQIREDPGRMEFLAECMERLLIKKFSKSFEEGEEYTQAQLAKVKHPELKKIIRRVLENFRWIEEMDFPNVQEGALMFFQKYCVYRLRKAIDDPRMKGINLCNDPGLGKTRTILAAVADKDASIFAPNAVVSAWEEEAGKALVDPDLLVLKDDHKDRKKQLRGSLHERRVTNVEFLRKVEDKERFELISSDQTIIVHDEAHSRKNEHSEQSKGAKMLPHQFVINVTATLARNPTELRRMLHTVDPERREFKSDEAFRKAFPMRDARAARQLKLILDQYTIRFRKHEVLEEIDPNLPLEDQLHCLPRKEHISPKVIGNFEMTEEQADSIYQMFVNWPAWTRKYGKYIPKDEVHQEDGLRTNSREGLAKIHAYRQVINNPGFAGVQTNEDPKSWQMQRIVRKCLANERKVVIFCKYQAQAEKYAEFFHRHKPALYTGQTSKKGIIRNSKTGKPALFSKEPDEKGYPMEDLEGKEMSHLDYERHTFQNADDRKIIIATYSTGSVGTTFTAGKVIIYDDLPTDCKEDIQAEDRIHRIDPDRQTHATVQYYQMQSRYPKRFLERMKIKWVRRNRVTGTWDEYKGKSRPKDGDFNPWLTAYEAFFEQGTYDKVQSRNLKGQRTMFHLINDGIADESALTEGDIQFSLFADEIERNGTLSSGKK